MAPDSSPVMGESKKKKKRSRVTLGQLPKNRMDLGRN